jgi:type I restriction enzyme S subunit
MRDGWTESTLGEVVNIQKGKKPPAVDVYGDFSQPYLTADVLRGANCEQFVSDVLAESCIQMSGHEAVLLWDGAGAGDVFKSRPGILASTMAKVEAKNFSLVDGGFLYLYLYSKRVEIKSSCRGTTVPHVSPEALKSLSFVLPPLTEQKRIVNVVASVDDYISALQQQADTARTARNAVLHELLSAGGDDWAETTLNLISHNVSNRRIPITKSDRNPGKYPYYGASGIVDYVDSYIFDERTLLISEDGANLTARSTPIAFGATGKYWVNNHAHVLKFDEISTQTYVEYYLNSIRIDEWVSGAAQPKLNQKSLNEIPIQLPPLGEQKRIVEIVSSMDEVIQATEQALVDTKNLRSGLLSDLLSGEHEIPESYDVFVGAA